MQECFVSIVVNFKPTSFLIFRMKFLTSALFMALVCLVVLTEVAKCAPEADPNPEADPFFFGGFGRGFGGGYGRGYGGYGGYGREGGGFGRRGWYGR